MYLSFMAQLYLRRSAVFWRLLSTMRQVVMIAGRCWVNTNKSYAMQFDPVVLVSERCALIRSVFRHEVKANARSLEAVDARAQHKGLNWALAAKPRDTGRTRALSVL